MIRVSQHTNRKKASRMGKTQRHSATLYDTNLRLKANNTLSI